MLKKYFVLWVAAVVMCLPACNSQPNIPLDDDRSVPGVTQSQTTAVPTTEYPGYGQVTFPDEPETDTTSPTVEDPVKESQPSDPVETVPEGTNPGQTTPTDPSQSTEPVEDMPVQLRFEEYLAMTGEEQYAYAQTFPSMMDYVNWYNAARAEYDQNEAIEITGPVDLDDLGGN